MLSENLRILRKSFKLTQQEVADILGVDRSTYTFYEAGKSTPTKENMIKLCDIYNVTVGYLLGVEKNCPELKVASRSDRVDEGTEGLSEISRNEKFLIMAYRSLDSEKKDQLIDIVKTALKELR
ncbi:MAG: helix-turn-helix transcriptional regulator [Clostridia bacterium]|nr:helix-turn-helix transcriptional regulator [Clostridia bacterium]